MHSLHYHWWFIVVFTHQELLIPGVAIYWTQLTHHGWPSFTCYSLKTYHVFSQVFRILTFEKNLATQTILHLLTSFNASIILPIHHLHSWTRDYYQRLEVSRQQLPPLQRITHLVALHFLFDSYSYVISQALPLLLQKQQPFSLFQILAFITKQSSMNKYS